MASNQDGVEPFEGWGICELMGHRKLGGYVTETVIAGAGMLRIDIPAEEGDAPFATQFYPPSALYCLTPCGEAEARAIAARNRPQPVTRFELPEASAVTSPVTFEDYSGDYDSEDYESNPTATVVTEDGERETVRLDPDLPDMPF